MKATFRFLIMTLVLCLAFAAPVMAQEEPSNEDPPKAPEAEPATAPAPESAPAGAAPAVAAPDSAAAPAAAALASAPPPAPAAKELGPMAKSFEPLAASYKKAYDDMQAWLATIDAQTTPVAEKLQTLQKQIQENDAAATQAKLAGDDKKSKSLQSENKKLKSELAAAEKSLSSARADYLKQASQKAKQFADASDAALSSMK